MRGNNCSRTVRTRHRNTPRNTLLVSLCFNFLLGLDHIHFGVRFATREDCTTRPSSTVDMMARASMLQAPELANSNSVGVASIICICRHEERIHLDVAALTREEAFK